jgi:hypothetical protein
MSTIFPDDGQPRISSRELARQLGMSHEELCQLIEQHRDQLLRHGPIIETREPEKDPNDRS